jgi:Uncharacterized protein conserved in bacteria
MHTNSASRHITMSAQPTIISAALVHKILFVGGIVIGVSSILLGILYGASIPNQDKALSGTLLAGVDVSGKSRSEIAEVANTLVSNIKFNITYDYKTVSAHSSDLGISIDLEKTVNDVINLNGKKNLFSVLDPWTNRNVDIVATYDTESIQKYLNETFPGSYISVKNPSIEYRSSDSKFHTMPSVTGKKIDANLLVDHINNALSNPQEISLTVASSITEPYIDYKAADEAAKYMNERLKLRLNINNAGSLIYYADPQDIAKWAEFAPNQLTGKIDISFNKTRIEKYIKDKITPRVPSKVTNKIVFVTANNQKITLRSGKDGQTITNTTELVDALHDAVTNKKKLNKNVKLKKTKHSTDTLYAKGESWLDVNLSKQTAALYSGDTKLITYSISSGTSITPTLPGTFRVWHKMRIQTMQGAINGEAYIVPDVEWISYFDSDGRAFHATYWHNNFGVPMSHGCINMTYEAAEALYQFAPIGTRVEVHY